MVGLVLEGGGLRGIYTGGVLDAMMEEEIWFPYVIGVSAGACNATSYLSRQKGRAGRVLLENVMDPRYVSKRNLLRHGSIFGMDFLFDEIPNRIDPFDFEAFRGNPAEFEVPVTNLHTGKADYYAKEALCDKRLTLLRATSSMPMLSKTVYYQGRPYLDGAVADSIPVRRALEKGCDRLLVVLTQPRGYIKKPMRGKAVRRALYGRYLAFRQALDHRHEMYNDTLALVGALEREGRALVLAPEHPIEFGAFEKDPVKLRRLYDAGKADLMREAEKIRALLRGEPFPVLAAGPSRQTP